MGTDNVSRFSELAPATQARLEGLAETGPPRRSIRSLAETSASGAGLGVEDAADLIAWGRDPQGREEIHAAARAVRERVAGRHVEFIIPVYLTSFCQNDCLYCGYRKGNPLAERVRLGLDEFGRELDLILSWGHRQIELVLSDDPDLVPDGLLPYVELTRRKLAAMGGGLVALCAPVYARDEYQRLRDAGLDWVVEWQETYHQPHFDRWHFLDTPKRHYQDRLDLWDTTIAAGLPRFALGVLLGLYDWRFDVLAVVEHGNYLRRTYGLEPHAVGIPRLKPARGVLASQKPSHFTVSDEDYRLIVSVYHLAFPRSRLFFNTREDYVFNLSLVAGGDLFTVDCETLPGGYLRGHPPGQFSTHSYPPRREVALALEQRGLTCRYLEAETAAVAPAAREASCLAQAAPFDLASWTAEHGQIAQRVDDFEAELGRLTTTPPLHSAAAQHLEGFLKSFATASVEHCRRAESLLARRPDVLGLPGRREFCDYHEHFGVDLDRFRRQIASYQLSADPTVLLMLGSRIVREFRAHLGAEQKLLGDPGGAAASRRMEKANRKSKVESEEASGSDFD